MRVHIPSALRRWTGGLAVIELPLALDQATTAAGALEMVARLHPGLRDRVLDEQGRLRRHVNLFIDGENARFLGGLEARVDPAAEIWIHPALSGGAPGSPARRRRQSYCGFELAIWTRQWTWFWSVTDSRGGGATGAAGSEEEAAGAARSFLERSSRLSSTSWVGEKL